LLCFICSLYTYGQTNYGLAFSFDNNKFTGDKPAGLTYEFKPGFSTFAFVDFRISDQVQLSLRPSFAQGGTNAIIDDTIDTDNEIVLPITNTYLGLSTLFKIYEREKIYAFVGPEINYLLNSEVRVSDEDLDLKNDLRDFGLFLDIGFGLNFDMFKKKWAVEWQFNQMLSTLNSKEDIAMGLSPRLRTSRTKLSLLYKFKKK